MGILSTTRNARSANVKNNKPQTESTESMLTIDTGITTYPIWVGWNTLGNIGEKVRISVNPEVTYIVTDEGAKLHARKAQESLEISGIPTHLFIISSGETSKTLETVRLIYQWLATLKAERGHLIIAVGGGVVGDLAGFVAATFMRGMNLVQVPTSLLAMMDASIGGKTGVDLPEGKNLVGAFHQPQFVLEDIQTLQTLPKRELISGWAEAIKHGLILDESLLQIFETQVDSITSLDRQICTDVARRSVQIKADVVSRDEKETLGLRVLLNYGHTVGHALEVVTKYKKYLHGEAVSLGMMAAAKIGNIVGLTPASDVERQRSLLQAYSLPVNMDKISIPELQQAMTLDKKNSAGSIKWVVLNGIGHATTKADISNEVVEEVLRDMMG